MPSNHLILCDPLLLLPSVFPSKRVFSMSQFSASGGQSTGVSASASVLPMNTQNWFPLGWNGWISLQAKSLPSHVLLFAIHWLLPTRLLRPWNFPGKSTGVGCHFLLQGIFLTQVSNPCLPYCRQMLYCLSHQESPLLQHHSSKASILQHSAFFTVQFSHPYMTTGKTIALTRWTLVSKVMSLLLNMLSKLVISFLPRSMVVMV